MQLLNDKIYGNANNRNYKPHQRYKSNKSNKNVNKLRSLSVCVKLVEILYASTEY